MAAAFLMTYLALLFAFMNGANDSGTLVASVVSSRALSPRRAVIIAAFAAFAGAMLLGSQVAQTLGEGLVRWGSMPPQAVSSACVAAAAAATLWCALGWKLGLPSSYTHALLGGWLGGFVGLGASVDWTSLAWVLAAILVTPVIGLLTSWAAMKSLYWLCENLSIQTKGLFRGLEMVGLAALGLAHGANAAQGSMALLVLAYLGLSGAAPGHFLVPLWARGLCAAAFSLGVLAGFTRTLKMIAFRIFRVEVLNSVCALGVSAGLLFASTVAGYPLSAGQVNSASLLGTGAGHNARLVRWDVAADFLANWALTFPVTAAISFFIVKVVQ